MATSSVACSTSPGFLTRQIAHEWDRSVDEPGCTLQCLSRVVVVQGFFPSIERNPLGFEAWYSSDLAGFGAQMLMSLK